MTNEELVSRIKSADEPAIYMEELWNQNLLFIRNIAGRYHAQADIEDLMQEGYLALCQAVKSYRPDEGSKFLSYAGYWIKKRMLEYIRCTNVIRIPGRRQREISSYEKFIAGFEADNGRKPGMKEIRHGLGLNDKEVQGIERDIQLRRAASLNSAIESEDADVTLSDVIPALDDVEDLVIDRDEIHDLTKEIQVLLGLLPKEQADVLKLRYWRGFTVNQTGECMGMSPAEVRRLERKALNELRKPFCSDRLRIFLGEDESDTCVTDLEYGRDSCGRYY